MPSLTRKRVLAAKIETTSGTSVSLAAADGQFNVEDVKVDADIQMTDRQAQNTLSKLSSVPGARMGRLSFSMWIHGSGTGGSPTPNWATTFLPACGFLQATNTFTPTSSTSNFKTLTMGVYEDGLFKQIFGAMGTVSFSGDYARPVKANFDFTGIWAAPTDVSNITPTYPTVVPPQLVSASLTIGAYSPKVSKITIAANNEIKCLESINTATGYAFSVITNRNFKGTLDPEAVTVASTDVFGQWLSGTEAALSLAVGGTAGNIMTFSGPKCQYSAIREGDRNGIVTSELEFQLNKSAAVGDDEMSIIFS